MISEDPLIVAPKPLVEVDKIEINDKEHEDQIPYLDLDESDLAFESVNVTETSKMFPNINQDYLRMLINKAINISFKEIREPVIKRVIPITLITTRAMILKDFALDPDAEKLKCASRNTSKSLSGMLAQITCKEPLKQHLTKFLKDLIVSSENPSINLLSDIEKRNLIEALRNENLEIG